MTWSLWDVVVVVFGVAQFGLLIWIALVANAFRTQNIAPALGRIGAITEAAGKLAEALSSASLANKDLIEHIVAEARSAVDRVTAPHPSSRLPINYTTIGRAYRRISNVFSTARGIRAIVRGKPALRTSASPARRKPTISIAQRMGLIPPIMIRLAPLAPYLRAALSARRQFAGRPRRRS